MTNGLVGFRGLARLILATHNLGKRAEMRCLLASKNLELLDPEPLGLRAPEEEGASFVAVARHKAIKACEGGGFEAIADDTGICVDRLNDEPGLLTKRWAQERGGWQKARLAMAQVLGLREDPELRARAHFMCGMAWATPAGKLWSAEAQVSGWLHWPAPAEGPGFVPMFLPDGGELMRTGVYRHRRLAFERLWAARQLELAGA